ncbi:choice-of-anchor I family protein [Corynebacterium sp. P5848]|uniref:choice-of-anchor I family protein n=1 Tax=Corynebacterium marambiense TaxID=2765364 RepID=UPI002260B98B|nr:choice-of-anchor I family protein [Corynebacterium marambiense]MCX7542512.1 choice-of-anchor I family protein [Corynebacterium marambiense]
MQYKWYYPTQPQEIIVFRRSSHHRSALALCVTTALTAAALTTPTSGAVIVENQISAQAPGAALSLTPLGTYESGRIGESAAEITVYHAASKRLLTVNAHAGAVDVIDIADPANPVKLFSISAGADVTINSVAVRADGLAVAAVEAPTATDPGTAVFFDAASDGAILGSVGVGALPDMVTITDDGRYALVANEGEPNKDHTVDPEGSVSVITLPGTIAAAIDADVRTAYFTRFTEGDLPEGVRVFTPEGVPGTVAQNLEPEYITTHGDTAWVSLQENNALAVIDIPSATVTDLLPLGTVDFREVPTDVSDKDGELKLGNWPLKGLLQPDAIASYEVSGTPYIVTANEGDARDFEEARVGDLTLCPGFEGLDAKAIGDLQKKKRMGRLKVTTTLGYNSDDSCYDELFAFGGRGFSIVTADGTRIYNSNDDFLRIVSQFPELAADIDGRSDDKGTEPEGITLGQIGGRTYAFIGLERAGGIMVYDITDPRSPAFVSYVNNRDYGHPFDSPAAGDVGPEGLAFIPAAESPNGQNLLAVANEVSGTTTIWEITAESDGNDDGDQLPVPDGSSHGSITGGVIAAILGTLGAVFAEIPVIGGYLHAALQSLQSLLLREQ